MLFATALLLLLAPPCWGQGLAWVFSHLQEADDRVPRHPPHSNEFQEPPQQRLLPQGLAHVIANAADMVSAATTKGHKGS